MLTFTHTTNPDDILASKHLLYTHYIGRMGWQFPEDTPTGWRIAEIQGRQILTDNYDRTSRWYVGQRNGMIETCLRILHKTVDSPLDVEHYNTTPAFREVIAQPGRYVEMNRFGFMYPERILEYMLNFWLVIMADADREGWTIIVTNGLGESRRFELLEVSPIPGACFKYHPDDPNDISTFCIPPTEAPRILATCRQILQTMCNS